MDEADSLGELAKSIPIDEIYRDLAQPAVKDIGTALQTVVRLLTYPLYLPFWTKQELRKLLFEPLAERLRGIPADQKILPRPAVAGKAIEGLLSAKEEPDLREMYLNLLASSIDAKTAGSTHPAFVEVLGQLTPDEARILRHFAQRTSFPIIGVRDEDPDGSGAGKDLLRHFNLLVHDAGCEHLGMGEVYLENLQRLGIVEMRRDNKLSDEYHYVDLENHPLVEGLRKALQSNGRLLRIQRGAGYVTAFGKQLVIACVGEARFSSPVLPVYRRQDETQENS